MDLTLPVSRNSRDYISQGKIFEGFKSIADAYRLLMGNVKELL